MFNFINAKGKNVLRTSLEKVLENFINKKLNLLKHFHEFVIDCGIFRGVSWISNYYNNRVRMINETFTFWIEMSTRINYISNYLCATLRLLSWIYSIRKYFSWLKSTFKVDLKKIVGSFTIAQCYLKEKLRNSSEIKFHIKLLFSSVRVSYCIDAHA